MQIETNDALRSQIPPEIQVDRSFQRPRTLRRIGSAQLGPSAAPTRQSPQRHLRASRNAGTTVQAVRSSGLPQRRRSDSTSIPLGPSETVT